MKGSDDSVDDCAVGDSLEVTAGLSVGVRNPKAGKEGVAKSSV